jgi:methylmalonyl-CoA mutase C-terminal domain/subunit
MDPKRKIRILSGKMGLDCHDNGIVAISNLLKERGYEVIYLGLHNSAEKILNAAIQEDVDLIGLSFLCGTHMPRIMELHQLMEEKGVHIPIMVGGVIPVQDAEKLEAIGIKTFLPGTPMEKIEEEGILKTLSA